MDSASQLKAVDLKVTEARITVLDFFMQHARSHLTAEQLHSTLKNSGSSIGVATVYRVVNQFEAKGLLKRHRFQSEHFVYELNNPEHHDHLVCVKCGEVKEFCDEKIETQQKNIAQTMGYQLIDHELNLYGVCNKCAKH